MDELKNKYQVALIIHVAMMASLLIYLLLVGFFAYQLTTSTIDPFQEENTLRYVFYGAAILLIVFIRRIRDIMMRRKTDVSHNLPSRLATASIITSSLCEIPVILGFVLFILTGSNRDFYFLLALSFILFIMYFPRFSVWEETGKGGTY